MKGSQRGKVLISPAITRWQSQNHLKYISKHPAVSFKALGSVFFFLLSDWSLLIFPSLSMPIFFFFFYKSQTVFDEESLPAQI